MTGFPEYTAVYRTAVVSAVDTATTVGSEAVDTSTITRCPKTYTQTVSLLFE